ncbi:MAG: hypothetical protein EB100_06895 [Crocinitomicaceae bacterium]|nr:hypothetical protein [Crocinitomicaceae bacterium]
MRCSRPQRGPQRQENRRYAKERVISFVPPDGEFTLLKYKLNGNCQLPIQVHPKFQQYPRSAIQAHFYQSILNHCFEWLNGCFLKILWLTQNAYI